MKHVIDRLLAEAEEAPAPRPAPRPARATSGSTEPWNDLEPITQDMIRYIASAARSRQLVRIRYRPKVTTGTAVYRTVQPYSLRWRDIHVDGYDAPAVRTVVFFGYDPYKGTIKMFVTDRIVSVERVGRPYTPQWNVEFESRFQKVIDKLLEQDVREGIFADLKHIYGAHAERREPEPVVLHRALEYMNSFLKTEVNVLRELSQAGSDVKEWMRGVYLELLPMYERVYTEVQQAVQSGDLKKAVIAVDNALGLTHLFGGVVDNLIIQSPVRDVASAEFEELRDYLVSIGRRPQVINVAELITQGESPEDIVKALKDYDADLARMKDELQSEDKRLEQKSGREGRCYELAGRWMISAGADTDALLVHGVIHSRHPDAVNPDLEHAWIVEGDKVWEPLQDKWWDKHLFYEYFNAEEDTVYTFNHMAKEMLTTEHWGPWEESKVQQVIDGLLELTEPEQDTAVDQMVQRYEEEPTNLWLYSDLPIRDRMALAYLTADNTMGAPYQGDKVRQFAAALKMTTAEPEGFWEQIRAKDPVRAEYLDKLEWSLEKVPLEDIGVYPHFGGFPVEWSKGNALDTAAALVAGTEERSKRAEVHNIAKQYATIIKFLPPILIPGTLLRDPEQGYQPTKWTTDDGNHRIIGAAIAGAKDVVAFVGRFKKEGQALTPTDMDKLQSGPVPPAYQESIKEQDFDQLDTGDEFQQPPDPGDTLGRYTFYLGYVPVEKSAGIDIAGPHYSPGEVSPEESFYGTVEELINHIRVRQPVTDNIDIDFRDLGLWSWEALKTKCERMGIAIFGIPPEIEGEIYGEGIKEGLSQVKYKIFVRVIFESAGLAFLEEMQEAGGDPSEDAERGVEDVSEIIWLAGVPEEDAVSYAQLMSEQFDVTYNRATDSITVRWDQLPQEYKQWTRHVARTPMPVEDLSELHSVAPSDALSHVLQLRWDEMNVPGVKYITNPELIDEELLAIAKIHNGQFKSAGEYQGYREVIFAFPAQDAAEEMKRNVQQAYPWIPVILVSSSPSEEDVDEMTTSGAAGPYEAPLGAQPYWKKKKKKKKKKKVEQMIDDLLN